MNRQLEVRISIIDGDTDKVVSEFGEWMVYQGLPDDWDGDQITEELKTVHNCVGEIVGAS